MKLLLLAALIALVVAGVVVQTGLAIGHSYRLLFGPIGGTFG